MTEKQFCPTATLAEKWDGNMQPIYMLTCQEMEPQEEICDTTGRQSVYILPTIFYLQSYIFRPTTVHLPVFLSSGMN
jgi:hypothetical protein